MPAPSTAPPSGDWTTIIVDSTGFVGQYTSLKVVDGKPAISYYDLPNRDLKYAYASTVNGAAVGDWTTITVDSTGTVGEHTSLAVVDGKPAISYYDQTNADLKFARNSAADGSGMWTTITVDGIGGITVGEYTSLAVVDGKPAISYYDSTNADLKYARNSAADGSGTWSLAVADFGSGTTGTVGEFTSHAIVNGKPAISYYDRTNSALRFSINSAADGSGTWATTVVDNAGDVGFYTSLAVVDGKPAISYQDSTISNQDLKYAINSAADGSGAWSTVTVDSTGNAGQFSSLALVDGKPAISYYDNTNGNLKYAYASTVNGAAAGDWTTITIDSTGFVGLYTSLAVVDGKPAISYRDSSIGDLKFARNSLADGSGSWTIATVDSVGNVGEFTSLAIVDGKPAISYADLFNGVLKFACNTLADGSGTWTSVTVDSAGGVGRNTSLAVVDGKPAISYLDSTNNDLKYAYASTVNGAAVADWTTITVDSTGDVGQHTSLAVVNGKPAISYYDNTNGDLKWARITSLVPPPTLAISNATANETNSGTTTMTFTVTRSGDTTNAITFDFNTTDGTATAGEDYGGSQRQRQRWGRRHNRHFHHHNQRRQVSGRQRNPHGYHQQPVQRQHHDGDGNRHHHQRRL